MKTINYEKEAKGRKAIESMFINQTNDKIGPQLIKIKGDNDKEFRIQNLFRILK